MQYFAVMITLLRDRKTFLEEIRNGIGVEQKIAALLVSSSIFFAIYGAIIGASSGGLQVLSSAIKLPALYLITLIICLPTLYFFDILFGSKLVFGQYTALILTTISIISVLLFSFAPVILFFLISIPDYSFFLLINVLIFTITGLVGVRLFYQAMLSLASLGKKENPTVKQERDFADSPLVQERDASQKADDNQAARRKLLQAWLVLYGLVGSQLGWTLRPFFGAPGEPFQLFRPEVEGNFYSTVLRIFWTFLGF